MDTYCDKGVETTFLEGRPQCCTPALLQPGKTVRPSEISEVRHMYLRCAGSNFSKIVGQKLFLKKTESMGRMA